MDIWIDAQLSPSLALWINQRYSNVVTAHSMYLLGLRDAEDEDIFLKAKAQNAVIMTKDADFVQLLELYGQPPQILWVTSGNTSNLRMREILEKHFSTILEMINNGEPLIEIGFM